MSNVYVNVHSEKELQNLMGLPGSISFLSSQGRERGSARRDEFGL